MARLIILLKLIFAQILANRRVTFRFDYNWMKLASGLACFSMALLLSACVTLQNPEASQENRSQIVAALQPGDIFEQSFTFVPPRITASTSGSKWISRR